MLWGKRGAHIAAAQAHAAQAWADRADLDRRLTFELRSRFVAVLVTTERLRLARENLTQYRDTVRISRLRADTGEIAPAEFDKIALEQRSFEKEVDDAEADAGKRSPPSCRCSGSAQRM